MNQDLIVMLYHLKDGPQPKASFSTLDLTKLLESGLAEEHDGISIYSDDTDCICITGKGLKLLNK